VTSKMMMPQTLTMMPVRVLPTSSFIAPSDQNISGQFSDHNPRKRARTNQSNTGLSEEWFPWEDKIVSQLPNSAV